MIKTALTFCFILLGASFSWAISEQNYQSEYQEKIVPFLLEHQEVFTFPSADKKYDLSAVRLINPQEKGVVVIMEGRCESWLLYGEVFYDLYNKGYSIYAYDHRGQGLSPHLVKNNPQIGHVEHFNDYVNDLDAFLKTVVQPVHPQTEGLFMIAHSMGGAIAVDYLEKNVSPFQAVVLASPMLKININPFSSSSSEQISITGEWQAFNHSLFNYYAYNRGEKGLLNCSQMACTLGHGREYAITQHDRRKNEKMDVYTGSQERWTMMHSLAEDYPQAILGGVSWRWLEQALTITPKLVSGASKIEAKLLVLEAENDQVVVNESTDKFCSSMNTSRVVRLPESQHEIFLEKDIIRNRALEEIERFFEE